MVTVTLPHKAITIMTTCSQCSAPIDGDLRECPVCAEPVTSTTSTDVVDVTDAGDLGADVGDAADLADGPDIYSAQASAGPDTGAAPSTEVPMTAPGELPAQAGGPPSDWAAAPPQQYRQSVAVAPITHPSGLSADVRTYGMLIHLSAFAASLAAVGFVGPLIMWLIKREEHPFLDHHGREALNFNLSILLYGVIGVALSVLTLGVGLVVVIPGAVVIGVMWFVTTIIAATKANAGEGYRYPMSIRFIKE